MDKRHGQHAMRVRCPLRDHRLHIVPHFKGFHRVTNGSSKHVISLPGKRDAAAMIFQGPHCVPIAVTSVMSITLITSENGCTQVISTCNYWRMSASRQLAIWDYQFLVNEASTWLELILIPNPSFFWQNEFISCLLSLLGMFAEL